jgi:hypothetical protein
MNVYLENYRLLMIKKIYILTNSNYLPTYLPNSMEQSPFEAFTAVMFQVEVFWFVTSGSVEDGGSMDV